jgi:hypothetical protein
MRENVSRHILWISHSNAYNIFIPRTKLAAVKQRLEFIAVRRVDAVLSNSDVCYI